MSNGGIGPVGGNMGGAGPVSQWFYSQRLKLHYVEWGPQATNMTDSGADSRASKARPTMVLVHGVQDHCRTWDALAAEFQDRYRILAPDLRGHGDSAWVTGASYHIWDYVYDLWQLTRSCGLEKITLVSHSMGSTIAAAFAGSFPELVEKLVIIEGVGLWPGWYSEVSPEARLRQWCLDTHELSKRKTRHYATQAEAIERMRNANPQLSDAQVTHLASQGSFQNEDGSYSWKFDGYTHGPALYSMPPEQTVALWANITAPVLIMNADEGFDHRIGQGGTLAHFKDAQSVTIKTAGHWTYHDQHDAVVEGMRGFGI